MKSQPATYSIPEAAKLLGVTRNTAYAVAARDGELAGIPIIRVGAKRLVLPRAPLEALLGLTVKDPEHEPAIEIL
jgi:excisionase family DNA binding protein